MIWALARLPGEIRIRNQDIAEPYLLFSNSHDGTRAIDLRLTTIRVVCQNTLNLALSDRKNEFVFKQSHSAGVDRIQAQAKAFFEFTQKEIRATEKCFQKLADTPLESDGFEKYLVALLPFPKPPEPGSSTSVKKGFETRKEKIEGLRSGITQVYTIGYSSGNVTSPPEPTLWGALNAVTAYVDYVHVLEDGDRYAYMMFGDGSRLKQAAYERALETIAG